MAAQKLFLVFEYHVASLDREQTVNYEILNADSPDATTKAEIYNIVDYPAIAIVREDGQLVALWQGALPTIDEVIHKNN